MNTANVCVMSGFFCIKRGITPFIYILCLEPFTDKIDINKDIIEIKIHSGDIMQTLFADDASFPSDVSIRILEISSTNSYKV